jgi:amino acid permease
MAEATSLIATEDSSRLERTIGFWGLTFVSLGSTIGSGWLLSAVGAATVAGPASLISWVVAAIIIGTLAFIHAELATAYPVAGGTARYPYFAFGALGGFTAGWTGLQATVAADSSLVQGAQLVKPIPIGIALRPGDPRIGGIQKAVKDMYQSGTMGSILTKWKFNRYAINP